MTGEAFVLIVDDEPAIAASVERMMRFVYPGARCEFVVATDPLTAIEAIDRAVLERRPLLVLADFNLSARLDGLQLLDEARRLAPSARLVLVSAYAREDLAARPEFRAAHAFLPKPFSKAELEEVVGPFFQEPAAATGGA